MMSNKYVFGFLLTFLCCTTLVFGQTKYSKFQYNEPVYKLSNAGYRIISFGPTTVNYSVSNILQNVNTPVAEVSPLGNEALIRMDKKLGTYSLSSFEFEIVEKLKTKDDQIVEIISDEFGKKYFLVFQSGKLASVSKLKNKLEVTFLPLDSFVSKVLWNNNTKSLLVAEDFYLYYLNPETGIIGDRLRFDSDISALSIDLDSFEIFVGLANGNIISLTQDLGKINYELSISKSSISSLYPDPLDHYLFVGNDIGEIYTVDRLKKYVRSSIEEFIGKVDLTTIYDRFTKNKYLVATGGNNYVQTFDLNGLEPDYQRIINDTLTRRKESFLRFRPQETAIQYDSRVNSKYLSEYLDRITQTMVDSIAKSKSNLTPIVSELTDSIMVSISPFPPLKIKKLKSLKSYDNFTIRDIRFNLEKDNTFSILDLDLVDGEELLRYSSDLRTMRYYEEQLELSLAKQIAKKELEFKNSLSELVQRLRSRGKLADVDLSVQSVLKKERDSLGNEELNLHVSFISQGVKAEAENQTADFPAGNYSLLDSQAATALVDFFVKSSSDKLQEYLLPGTRVTFKITGSTDKSPISGSIPYNGEFGDFQNFPYYFQGDLSGMNLTTQSGIKENSQLGFLRTYSVRNFIENNTELFDLTKNKFIHFSEEADDYGPQFRRIKVEMIIHKIDKLVQPESQSIDKVTLSDVDIDIPRGVKTKAYALVIGNEDYSSFQKNLSRENDVPYAVRDAEVFSNYLNQMYQVPRENIELVKNGTYGEISQSIAKLERIMELDGSDSEIIVFYSGHGMPDEASKDPYIIPVDISGLNVNQGISLKEFMSRVGKKPHKKISFILDACFSGLGKSQPLASVKGITVVPTNPELGENMILLSSSSSNESSVVDDQNKHGLFTYHLLKILKESEGKIGIETLYDQLMKDVGLSAIKKHNKVQTPSLLVGTKLNANKTETALISTLEVLEYNQ